MGILSRFSRRRQRTEDLPRGRRSAGSESDLTQFTSSSYSSSSRDTSGVPVHRLLSPTRVRLPQKPSKPPETAEEKAKRERAELFSRVYKPLDHEHREIRLLKLTSSRDGASARSPVLDCKLQHFSLHKCPEYIALSYSWGDPKVTADIKVNGNKLPVTTNLEAALRRLRRVVSAEQHVWADALCINQMDKTERSLQVPRIHTVFRKASEVVVWLGGELDIDERARSFLRAGRAPGIDKDGCLSNHPVFQPLLNRPFWSRVWIIQELAVASQITLYCGEDRIPWQAVDVSCDCCPDGGFINARGRLTDENVARFALLRGVRRDALTQTPVRLLDALHRSRSSLATDPRDKLFALLGLAFDGLSFVPEPSYMGSVSECYTEFATALLKNNLPLDIIYLRSAQRKVEGELPSWVPDWTDLNDAVAHRQFHFIMKQLINGKERLTLEISVTGNMLSATGILFDAVDGLGSAFSLPGEDASAHEGGPPHELTTPYESDDELSLIVSETLLSTELLYGTPGIPFPALYGNLHRFWNTKTAEKLQELLPVMISPTLSESVCTWLAENRSFVVYGRTIEWWSRTWVASGVVEITSQAAHHFLNMIQSRMRLLMTEQGYLGWAHPQARKGDKICLLSHCTTPVILRDYGIGYRVVGDAHLSRRSMGDLMGLTGSEEVTNLRILA